MSWHIILVNIDTKPREINIKIHLRYTCLILLNLKRNNNMPATLKDVTTTLSKKAKGVSSKTPNNVAIATTKISEENELNDIFCDMTSLRFSYHSGNVAIDVCSLNYKEDKVESQS